MTQFQIKGGISLHRRIFFMFKVRNINNFGRHFPTDISFVRKKLTKNNEENVFFWFFTI